MALRSLNARLRRPLSSRTTKRSGKRSHPSYRGRLTIDPLEERCLLDAAPVALASEHLQFGLVDKTANWTVAGTVYATTGEVTISTTDNSKQSLLLIENGVSIDTNPLGPSF